MHVARRWSVAILALGAVFFGASAHAEYPDRTIHFLLGVAPGGSNDTLARLLATKD